MSTPRRVALAALLASVSACSFSSSKTDGPAASCATAESVTGVPAACTANADCCSYACVAGSCQQTAFGGGVCRSTADCASPMLCKAGACVANPVPACRDDGDVCTAGAECCGGHCGGASPTAYGRCGPDHAPVASAGTSRDISYTQPYTLENLSTDPDGDTLYFTWSLTSYPGATPPSFSTTARTPTFTPTAPGPYVFHLLVTDGLSTDAWRMTSTADVTLTAVNLPPVVTVTPPAGAVSRNVPLTLSGAVTDPDGNATTCTWTATAPGRTAPDASLTQSGPCAGTTTFAFTPSLEGPWTVALAGDDGYADPTRPVTRAVTVTVANDAPVAKIVQNGLNEPNTIYANVTAAGVAQVTLDASPSSDANGDAIVHYTWTTVTGAAAATFSDQAVQTVALPAGDYQLQLVVTDPPWTAANDPVYAGAYRDGANGAPLAVTVHVAPAIAPLGHDVVDAAYARTANRIALLGHNPGSQTQGSLWTYDVATGQEGAAIALQDPVGLGWSNGPRCVAVTADGTTALVGDDLLLWEVTALTTAPAVAKYTPPGAIVPIGDIAIAGTRHAFVFKSDGTAPFEDFDPTTHGFTPLTGYGRSGAVGPTGSPLYVANSQSSFLDRYVIQSQSNGNSTVTFAGSTTGFYCASPVLWAGQSGAYLFSSCGDVYSTIPDAYGALSYVKSLGFAPVQHLDSLADGRTVAEGTWSTQVTRFSSTLGVNPPSADQLPIWADAAGGKHASYALFAFVAADGSRIVFLRTNEPVPRYGVYTFTAAW